MKNKVYALLKRTVTGFDVMTYVVSIHSNKLSVEKKAEELENLNPDKIQSDSYGPVCGTWYEIEEYELQD